MGSLPFSPALTRAAAAETRAFLAIEGGSSPGASGPGAARPPAPHRVGAPPGPGRLPADRPPDRLRVRALGARARGRASRRRPAAGRRGLPADRGPAQPAPPRRERRGASRAPGGARAPAARAGDRAPREEGVLLLGLPDRHALGGAGRRLAAPLPPQAAAAAARRPSAALAQVPAARLLPVRRLLPDEPAGRRRLPGLALQPRRRREDALLLRASLAGRGPRSSAFSRCCPSSCPTSGAAISAPTGRCSARSRSSRRSR